MGDVIDARRRFKPSALDKILKKAKSVEIGFPSANASLGIGALGSLGSLANNSTKHHSDALEYVFDAAGVGGAGANLAQNMHKLSQPFYNAANEAKGLKSAGLKGAAIGGTAGLLLAMLQNKNHKKAVKSGYYGEDDK